MQKPGLKRLLHVSATRGGSDYIMGGVGRLENSGEMLGANQQGEMIMYRKHFSFLMQVIDRGILTQPVTMQSAEFWIVWSFWTRDDEVLGNQMGYIRKGIGLGYMG